MPLVELKDNILNSLKMSIYVSDLVTNEILYANMTLRQRHGNQSLVGKICWEVLENKSNRCESCPIPYLLKHPGECYQREIYTDRRLKIYDSIILWENDKLAHLRYIVDVAKE